MIISDHSFIAEEVYYQFPLLKDSTVTIDSLRIDRDGTLTLGDAEGKFSLPDFGLGDPNQDNKFGIFLSDVYGTVGVTGTTKAFSFELGMEACLEIRLPENDNIELILGDFSIIEHPC